MYFQNDLLTFTYGPLENSTSLSLSFFSLTHTNSWLTLPLPSCTQILPLKLYHNHNLTLHQLLMLLWLCRYNLSLSYACTLFHLLLVFSGVIPHFVLVYFIFKSQSLIHCHIFQKNHDSPYGLTVHIFSQWHCWKHPWNPLFSHSNLNCLVSIFCIADFLGLPFIIILRLPSVSLLLDFLFIGYQASFSLSN